MGVITTQHLDDSELTAEELDHWGPIVKDSLRDEYFSRMQALHASRLYSPDEAGWEQLQERAWQETIESNEVCKAVSAISAKRRVEKMLASGNFTPPAKSVREATAEDVEMVLRAANPHGDLALFDGTPLKEGELGQITQLANDPERLAEALKGYEGTFEGSWAWGEILSRLRETWAKCLGPRRQEMPAERSPKSLFLNVQHPIDTHMGGGRPA